MARAVTNRHKTIATVAAWIVALLIFFPILYTIITSFKSEAEAIKGFNLIPSFTLESYVEVQTQKDYFKPFMNSVILSLGSTVLALVVAVPAPGVLAALEDCAAKGVGGAVVLSSGFAETGGQGVAWQAGITALARRTGMRVVGPSCMGLINVRRRLLGTFTPSAAGFGLVPGRISLVSQSGAFGGYCLSLIRQRRGEGLPPALHQGAVGADAGLVGSGCCLVGGGYRLNGCRLRLHLRPVRLHLLAVGLHFLAIGVDLDRLAFQLGLESLPFRGLGLNLGLEGIHLGTEGLDFQLLNLGLGRHPINDRLVRIGQRRIAACLRLEGLHTVAARFGEESAQVLRRKAAVRVRLEEESDSMASDADAPAASKCVETAFKSARAKGRLHVSGTCAVTIPLR